MLRKRTLLKPTATGPDSNTRLLLHLDGSVVDASTYSVPVNTYGGTFVTGKFSQGFYGGYPSNNTQLPIGIGDHIMTNVMTGTFTVDMWFNWNTLDTTSYGAAFLMYFGIDMVTPGSSTWFVSVGPSSGGDTPTRTISLAQVINGMTTASISTNVSESTYSSLGWVHLAVTRDINNNVRVYIHGNNLGSVTPMTDPTGGSGSPIYGPYTMFGMGGTHIDEIRVSDNVRWTSNFTPPTAPYA